jgi:hypothetical protein
VAMSIADRVRAVVNSPIRTGMQATNLPRTPSCRTSNARPQRSSSGSGFTNISPRHATSTSCSPIFGTCCRQRCWTRKIGNAAATASWPSYSSMWQPLPADHRPWSTASTPWRGIRPVAPGR